MRARNFRKLIMIITCAITVVAQERPKVAVNSNGEIVAPPQMEEYVRRRMELLKNPDFLKLKLDPIASKHDGESEDEPESFRVGKKIRLELLMTNTLSEPFVIDVGSSYGNTRPLLIKDGQTVQYNKEATKLMENKNRLLDRTHGLSIILRPNRTQSAGTINLSDWYEPLEPGSYLLTVQYRIQGSEKWIESSSVAFVVVTIR